MNHLRRGAGRNTWREEKYYTPKNINGKMKMQSTATKKAKVADLVS